MGVEPTQGSFEPHAGFEDQERHRAPVTSASGLHDFLVKHHNRRAAECNRHPNGLVDLRLREAHLAGLLDLDADARAAPREDRQRGGEAAESVIRIAVLEEPAQYQAQSPLARRRLKIPLSPLRVRRVEKGLVENESYGPTALGGENLSTFVLPHPLSEV